MGAEQAWEAVLENKAKMPSGRDEGSAFVGNDRAG